MTMQLYREDLEFLRNRFFTSICIVYKFIYIYYPDPLTFLPLLLSIPAGTRFKFKSQIPNPELIKIWIHIWPNYPNPKLCWCAGHGSCGAGHGYLGPGPGLTKGVKIFRHQVAYILVAVYQYCRKLAWTFKVFFCIYIYRLHWFL